MPFTPENIPEVYIPSPSPVLGNDRGYLERELRTISLAVNKLQAAVREIQEHLDTLP